MERTELDKVVTDAFLQGLMAVIGQHVPPDRVQQRSDLHRLVKSECGLKNVPSLNYARVSMVKIALAYGTGDATLDAEQEGRMAGAGVPRDVFAPIRAQIDGVRAHHTRLFEQNVQSKGLRVECDLAAIQALRDAYTPDYYTLPWIPIDAVPPLLRVHDSVLGVECWALSAPMPPLCTDLYLVDAYIGTLAKIVCDGRSYTNRSAVYYDFLLKQRGGALHFYVFLAVTQC